jgi:hypothetical protein
MKIRRSKRISNSIKHTPPARTAKQNTNKNTLMDQGGQGSLTPVSLMMLGVGETHDKEEINQSAHNGPVRIKPQSGDTTGYPSNLDGSPANLAINSINSHSDEIRRLRHETDGSEHDTIALFLEKLEQKIGELVVEQIKVPRDRSSWIQGDLGETIRHITKASGAAHVYLGQDTGVADLLGTHDSLGKAKLLINSKIKLSSPQPSGFASIICEICISSSYFFERLHNF